VLLSRRLLLVVEKYVVDVAGILSELRLEWEHFEEAILALEQVDRLNTGTAGAQSVTETRIVREPEISTPPGSSHVTPFRWIGQRCCRGRLRSFSAFVGAQTQFATA
jgi:hypothetical protein